MAGSRLIGTKHTTPFVRTRAAVMPRGHIFSAIFVLLASCVTAAQAAPATSPPGGGTLLVGAASHTVLPLVNGGYGYLEAGFPARNDAYDPGILVPKWDAGRIA